MLLPSNLDPGPSTRNLKHETRSPKLETPDPRPETRNPKPETRYGRWIKKAIEEGDALPDMAFTWEVC